MNRRGFLAALAGAIAYDPERLLWTPGARLISIPSPRAVNTLLSPDVIAREWLVMLKQNLVFQRELNRSYSEQVEQVELIGRPSWVLR